MKIELDPRWDHRSPEEIRSEQGRRLRRFLAEQIVPFSPYYRRVFEKHGIDPASIRTVDDLERIPFTTKEDIAPTRDDPQRPRDLVLAPTRELLRERLPLPRKLGLLGRQLWWGEEGVTEELTRQYQPISVFFTTGRTALPTAFLLTRYDLAILEEVGRRIIAVTAMDAREDKIINLFPYAPHLAFWQVYYTGIGGTVFTLNTGGGKVMGTDGILLAIQKIRPAYLVGIPGYMYHALREAHSRGLDLSFVKGLALGGDQVTAGYRSRVKDLLRQMGAKSPRVVSVLGFTEARKCWSECPGEEECGFHTYPDLEVVEIVDPKTGRRVGEGETGELVYTCLAGRGSSILRYRTGDLIVGGATLAPCPACGRTVPRLASQLDRVSNLRSFQLSKVKGTLVNLNLFKDELEKDPRVEEWQLVIKKRDDDPFNVDELHLNLALAAEAASAEKVICGEIEKRLFEVTEVHLNTVKVLPLKVLLDLLGMETQLKEKRIVDLRAVAPTSAAPVSPAAEATGEELGDETAKPSALLARKGMEEAAERTGADGLLGRDQ
jgi:phenylacetate-coenzyme A ligase PaaK-like adenylate-forming protein